MFYVGQNIICIDNSASAKYHHPGYLVMNHNFHGLKQGGIYTVRDVVEYLETPCLYLKEIIREFVPKVETGFSFLRFRPIVDRKTDISIFEKMLKPEKVDA